MKTVAEITIAILNLARWGLLALAILPIILPAFGRYGLVIGLFGFIVFAAFFIPSTIIIKTLKHCVLGKDDSNDK